MHSRLLLFAALALSACAAGPSSVGGSDGAIRTGETMIPPMPPHVASYQKWEHLCVWTGSREELSEAIAEAGEKGWEMVTLGSQHANFICFKRPKPPVPAAPEPTPEPAPAAAPTPPATTPPPPGP